MSKHYLLIATLCVVLSPFTSVAQNYGEVSFSYDANGNRVGSSIRFGRENRNDLGSDSLFYTRISDVIETMVVSLYPNPTPNCFTVSINKDKDEEIQVVLFTVDGKALDVKILKSGNVEFDLSSHPSGLYLVKLTMNGASKVWKVLKT